MLYLKERRRIALQVACGDITDVELKENKLIINISDGMIYNLLSEGKRELENALKWQGLDLEIDINVKKEELSTQEKDIEKLKDLFGENLVIKGGK